jgi:hypothetical protein
LADMLSVAVPPKATGIICPSLRLKRQTEMGCNSPIILRTEPFRQILVPERLNTLWFSKLDNAKA